MMKRGKGDYRGLAEASSVGIALVLTIAIGFGIGYLLDRRLGTEPWFTVVFTILGMIAGIINLLETARSLSGRR